MPVVERKTIKVVEFDESTGILILEVGTGKRRYSVPAPINQETGEFIANIDLIKTALVRSVYESESSRIRGRTQGDTIRDLVGLEWEADISSAPQLTGQSVIRMAKVSV